MEYVQTCVEFTDSVCTATAWVQWYTPVSITDPTIQSLLMTTLLAWAAVSSLRLLLMAAP